MFSVRLSLIVASYIAAVSPAAAISVSQFNLAYTQDFDGLVSAVPTGWAFLETGTGADTSYGAGTGSSSTGDTYSFGAAGSGDRAFGTLQTGTVVSSLGVQFTNDTGAPITQFNIQYTGEQWRLGATNREDRLKFSYSLTATSLGTGSWTDVSAFDFLAPVTTGTVGTRDGNAAANQTAIGQNLTGFSLAPGATVWLRWSDLNASGSDDGLAIDNFSLTAVSLPAAESVPDGLPLTALATVLAGMALVRSAAARRTRARAVATIA